MICLNQDPSRVRLSCWWFRLVHPLIDFPCFHPPRLPPALPGAQARPFPSSVSRLWLPASSRCHLIGSCIFVIAQRHSASGFVCRLGARARARVCVHFLGAAGHPVPRHTRRHWRPCWAGGWAATARMSGEKLLKLLEP